MDLLINDSPPNLHSPPVDHLLHTNVPLLDPVWTDKISPLPSSPPHFIYFEKLEDGLVSFRFFRTLCRCCSKHTQEARRNASDEVDESPWKPTVQYICTSLKCHGTPHFLPAAASPCPNPLDIISSCSPIAKLLLHDSQCLNCEHTKHTCWKRTSYFHIQRLWHTLVPILCKGLEPPEVTTYTQE